MLQKKILKLMKILNRFTLDDIVTTLELVEKEEILALNYIQNLEKENVVRQISPRQYAYCEKNERVICVFTKTEGSINREAPKIKMDKVKPNPIDITKDENYEKYLNARQKSQIKVNKYLKIIEAAGCLGGKNLMAFIKEWNKKNPELATSYSYFMGVRNLYREKGIGGLLINYGNYGKGESIVNDELYALCKEFYFTGDAMPLTAARALAIQKYIERYPDKKNDNFPQYSAFRKRIFDNYSAEERRKLRSFKFTGKNTTLNSEESMNE